MTEDLDKDLEGLAGDLDNLDLGDDPAGGDEAAADAEGESGGDSIELDDDLAAMLEDSGEDAGGGDAGGDEAMADASADAGGEDVSVDDMLGELAGEDAAADAGADAGAPAAAAAPAPAAPKAPPLPSLSGDQAVNLEFLLDIKLHVTFEVGRSKMLISDLLTLGQGSVIELHRLVGDELDFLVNGKLVAKGEVVVVNEKFGCKINEIIPPEDRIKHLGSI